MALTTTTWQLICDYVSEFIPKDGAHPNRTLIRTLGNRALSEMSQAMKGVYTEWTSSVTVLPIVGRVVTLPNDLLRIDSVWWNGIELPHYQRADNDADGVTVSTTSGTPCGYTRDGSTIRLDVTPSGSTTGLLIVRGWGLLGEFSDVAQAANPLEKVPAQHQLAPAYFIIAQMPLYPAVPASTAPEAIAAANAETQRRVAVKQQYQQMWDAELVALSQSEASRRHELFAF